MERVLVKVKVSVEGKGEVMVMSDNVVVGSGLCAALKAGLIANSERASVDL